VNAVCFAGIAALLLSFNACNNKDECNIPCYNGACVNNSCNCSLGYEGDSCTVPSVDKFIGNWDGIDSCETDNYIYTATIAGSSSVTNQLIITNFGRFGTSFTVTADISGFSFTVPLQNVQGLSLSGSGVIDTVIKQITVIYEATDVFGNTDHCGGTWQKQQ